MIISYDIFTGAFLSKITEYDILSIEEEARTVIIDGYMKRAISQFQHICHCDLIKSADDENREFDIELTEDDDLTEIVDIVSEGMVVNWMKPYVYKQEILEMTLNTKDFTTYSPAEMIHRLGEAYEKAQSDFTQMMREYSFNHGDLTTLHL
ncbi:MAG: hypothetical protein IKI58_04125 [Oscillospiraceae bacterium]|nr:hypothetical protein [Oscillospiraceae bacterium]